MWRSACFKETTEVQCSLANCSLTTPAWISQLLRKLSQLVWYADTFPDARWLLLELTGRPPLPLLVGLCKRQH